MTRLVAALTVLLIHTGAAYAQQFPAETGPFAQGPGAPAAPSGDSGAPAAGPPAPMAGPPAPIPAPPPPPSSEYPPGYGPPPGYAPPSGYGPPPSYYGAPPRYAPPPVYAPRPYGYGYGPRTSSYYRYAPVRQRAVTDRPFTIGGGIGFGGLALNQGGQSTNQSGMSYTARLGIGLHPGFLLLWDIEGSIVDRGASVFSQTAQLAALQIFVGDRFFLKGGMGLAQVNQDDYNYTTWGFAWMGGVGLELIQGWNWSLDIESTITGAHYTIANHDETWLNWSIANFAVNFF